MDLFIVKKSVENTVENTAVNEAPPRTEDTMPACTVKVHGQGTAAVKVDHTVDSIRFEHPSIGEVTVRQDLEFRGEGRDATARLCWDAAFPMAQFLCEHAESVRGRDVVELGAGPGLPGLVAAKLGASRVTLTDLPSELELLRTNVSLNGFGEEDEADEGSSSGRVDVAACTWGEEAQMSAVGKRDVVVCSDVLYGHHADVARALARTMRALVRDDGICLVAYFSREKLMHDLAFFEECDLLFEDPVQRTVVGVDEEDKEDLWFFEYRPK